MKKYGEYKDSGFDWIGKIPAQWDNLRLRFVCELRNGYTPSKDNSDYWEDGTIPWYRMEDIRDTGRKLQEAKQYITEEAVKGGGLFDAGSFILATTATIGEHALLIVDSLANQQFTNLKIRKSLSNILSRDYFFYYLFVIDDYCKATTKTSTFPAVSMELLKNCHIVFPSFCEQTAIAAYLDTHCAKIDNLISIQQKRIALLQELKQSIITHAVTKGLNPNVEMKQSGVEWIGDVPNHWEVIKLKYKYHFQTGATPNTGKKENFEGDLRWANISDLNGSVVYDTTKHINKEAASECSMNISPKGSLMYSFKLSVGTVAFCGEDMYTNEAIASFIPQKNDLKYLFYCAPIFIIHNANRNIYNAPLLNQELIKNALICLPSLNEQTAIATYLDHKCATIDTSISNAQHQIDLLQEYKQSLITEVVTGKRKVTDN